MSTNRLVKDLISPVDTDPRAREYYSPILPGEPGYPGFPAWDEIVDHDTFGIVGSRPNPDYNPGAPLSPSNQPVLFTYGPIHAHEIIHHPALPRVSATPQELGVVLLYQFGWGDCYGLSNIPINADGQFQFSVKPSSIGIFCGLWQSRYDANQNLESYTTLDFGFRFDGDQYWVYELGVPVTGVPGTYIESDVFTVRRLGADVAYYINTTLVHRSAREETGGTLYAHAYLFAGGDEIDNAEINLTVDSALRASEPAEIAITVPGPIRVSMSDTDDAFVTITAPALRLEIGHAGIEATVPSPTVAIMGEDFAGIAADVPVPTVSMQGDGFVVPSYGIIEVRVPAPSVAMYGNEADYPDVTITVPSPRALLWDGDGLIRAEVPVPRVFMLDESTFGIITASMPRMTASIDAQVLPSYFNQGIRATMPRMTAALYGGGRIRSTMPKMTAAIVATAAGYGTIAATMPRMTASVSVSAGSVTTIAARMPRMTALAYGGGRVVATMPSMTAALVGQSGTVAAVAATMPVMTAVVSGYAGRAATITATMPMMVALSGSYITATMPRMRALISANESSYAVTEAYAVTLNNETAPVTRFTNYPFHSIIRIGNRTIGFGPSGARLLAGDDDAGTPIAWTFTLGATDELPGNEFGQGVNKANEGTYWNGRFDDEVELSVSVDDGATYTYTAVPGTGVDTVRLVPGRGLRGFRWTFGLSGIGAMNLYRAEFLQRSLRRKVKHGT